MNPSKAADTYRTSNIRYLYYLMTQFTIICLYISLREKSNPSTLFSIWRTQCFVFCFSDPLTCMTIYPLRSECWKPLCSEFNVYLPTLVVISRKGVDSSKWAERKHFLLYVIISFSFSYFIKWEFQQFTNHL